MSLQEILERLEDDEVLYCHFVMMEAAARIAEAWHIAPEGKAKDKLLLLAEGVRRGADIFWTLFDGETRARWAEALIRFREMETAPPYNSELDVQLIFAQKYDAIHRRKWLDYFIARAGFASRETFYRSVEHDAPSQASIDKWIDTGDIRQDVANRLLTCLNSKLEEKGHDQIGYWDLPHEVIKPVALEEPIFTAKQKSQRVAKLQNQLEVYEDACRGATTERAQRWHVELERVRRDLKDALKEVEVLRSAAEPHKNTLSGSS